MGEAHYRKLERMYLAARINAPYQPSIEIGQGTCEVRIPIKETYHHAADAVHGMLYFKVMDDAAFFAANSLVEDVFVLTADMHVDFLRPVSDGELVGRAHVVKPGRRRIVCRAVAEDADGRELGCAQGSFMRSDLELGPELGYE